LHHPDEERSDNRIADQEVDVRDDLEDTRRGRQTAEIAGRQSIQVALLVDAQTQTSESKEYPVPAEERDEAEAHCLASRWIISSNAAYLPVHQVQPKQREYAKRHEVQQDRNRDGERRQLMRT
jgi:hypothetical protein